MPLIQFQTFNTMAFKHHEIVSVITHRVLFIKRLNGSLEYKHNDEFFEEQVKNPLEKILVSKQILNDEFYSKEEIQFVFMLLDKKLEEFKSKNIEYHMSYLQTYENNETVSKELLRIKNEIIELYIKWRNSFIKIKSHNGFMLNHYSDEQLKKLCRSLIDLKLLHKDTEEPNFVNAFNGTDLNPNFKPLEWIEPTAGAVFSKIFLEEEGKSKVSWTKLKPLFAKANYKQLLHQANENGTFDFYENKLPKKILY